jgi:hypothetical protein
MHRRTRGLGLSLNTGQPGRSSEIREVHHEGTDAPPQTDILKIQADKRQRQESVMKECRRRGEELDDKIALKSKERKEQGKDAYAEHVKRYDTQADPDAKGNYYASTTVWGRDKASYYNRFNFKEGEWRDRINYRQLSGDVPPGYTSDMAPGEDSKQIPQCSDTSYCQAVKSYQMETNDANRKDLGNYRFRVFIAEDVTNKRAVDAIAPLVKPGERKTFNPGTDEFNTIKGTPPGERACFRLQQHFEGQELNSITVDRTRERDENRIPEIRFNLN